MWVSQVLASPSLSDFPSYTPPSFLRLAFLWDLLEILLEPLPLWPQPPRDLESDLQFPGLPPQPTPSSPLRILLLLSVSQNHAHLRRAVPTYRICMLGCRGRERRKLNRVQGRLPEPYVRGLHPRTPGCPTSQTWSPPSCISPSCLLGERQQGAMRCRWGRKGQSRAGELCSRGKMNKERYSGEIQ